uniref:Plant heme peroxidase family profile domain-containing protein n=1 Tax=Ananas comosus var. bracteatus TaxID=296719 RepID=A0A6V7QSK5_ANACO
MRIQSFLSIVVGDINESIQTPPQFTWCQSSRAPSPFEHHLLFPLLSHIEEKQSSKKKKKKKNTKKKKKKKKKKRMSGVLRWGATLLAVSLLLSLIELGGEGTKKPSNIPPLSDLDDRRIADKPRQLQDDEGEPSTSFSFSSSAPSPQYLEVGFYRRKCPRAEEIVESTVNDLYSRNSSVAPALLRLLFHDCFIHGCDGSVLLDRINGSLSERDAIPNRTLRGFDAVDAIKSAVEAVCPATVSCGGPSYTVFTGRRDSVRSFYDEAQIQIPTPNDTYAKTLSSFASRGFTERETVALLGAHSIGKVHCRFFRDRLYDFAGTGEPDGSLDREMVEEMRAICGGDAAAAAAAEEAGMEMGYCREGREVGFGSHYYWRLLEGRGILRADQQLTAGRTVRWVRAYAAGWEGERAFRADFAGAMVKLSALGPPSPPRDRSGPAAPASSDPDRSARLLLLHLGRLICAARPPRRNCLLNLMIHFTGTRQQLFQPAFIMAQFALQEIVTKTEKLIGNSSLFNHAYL